MEIGFNAGHSAELFLKYTSAHVTSFDLGDHPYVTHAKEYIDAYYPGRHSLILGDSTVTVPKCIGKYDIIFIDGGHSPGRFTECKESGTQEYHCHHGRYHVHT